MPTRETAPAGAPCWIELMTSDPDGAREFYGELFGWTSEQESDEKYGGYINFSKDGRGVAGGMKNDGSQGMPDTWSVYLASDDARATAAAATAAGGQVLMPPMAVDPYGTMAILADPTGAAIGVWQPGDHKGFDAIGEPGAPAWFELHTRDHKAAVSFYQHAFGWNTTDMSDSDEFRYTVLQSGDAQLAGIMDASSFLPEGVPSNWSIYFQVEDTDKALARVEELGGRVLQPAEDTPYGRLAAAADSTGATFKLLGPTTS